MNYEKKEILKEMDISKNQNDFLLNQLNFA